MVLGLPQLPLPALGMLPAAAVSSSSCPACARCKPKLGFNGGPADWLPSPESLPPTRTKVASIYLALGCPGFICLAEMQCWVGLSWTPRVWQCWPHTGPEADGFPASPVTHSPVMTESSHFLLLSPLSLVKHHNHCLHLPSAPSVGGAGLGLASNGDGGGNGGGDEVSMWHRSNAPSFSVLACNLCKTEFCTIPMTMSV